MNELSLENNNVIFHEMMSHPALFSHPSPKKVAVIGDDGRILSEILKHETITELWHIAETKTALSDDRIRFYSSDNSDWIQGAKKNDFDIVINLSRADAESMSRFFDLLHTDGVLIQESGSPFHLAELKQSANFIQAAGFADLHVLNFPQPSFSSGWRAALMARKEGHLKRVREKDVFNRKFKTVYYNFDIHKASMALPEFLRQEGIPL